MADGAVAGTFLIAGQQGFEVSVEPGHDGRASAEEAECDFSETGGKRSGLYLMLKVDGREKDWKAR